MNDIERRQLRDTLFGLRWPKIKASTFFPSSTGIVIARKSARNRADKQKMMLTIYPRVVTVHANSCTNARKDKYCVF